MSENEVYNLISKLYIARKVLHLLLSARKINDQRRIPLPLPVTESFPYEETVKRLARHESSLIKWLLHEIGEDQLKIERSKVETRLCLSFIRDGARTLMHGVSARENFAESEQLKRVVKEAEKLIEMIEKGAR